MKNRSATHKNKQARSSKSQRKRRKIKVLQSLTEVLMLILIHLSPAMTKTKELKRRCFKKIQSRLRQIHHPRMIAKLKARILKIQNQLQLKKLKLKPPMSTSLPIHTPQFPAIFRALLELKINLLIILKLKSPMSLNLPIHTPQFPAIFKALLILQIKLMNQKQRPPMS